IRAVAAFIEIAALAWIPNHPVVAGLTKDLIVASAAGQRVVAIAAEEPVDTAFAQEGVVARVAEELIRPAAAGERVVAQATEQQRRRQRAVGLIERKRIVAALTEDLNQCGVRNRGSAALDRDRAAVDQNAA